MRFTKYIRNDNIITNRCFGCGGDYMTTVTQNDVDSFEIIKKEFIKILIQCSKKMR